jgi:Family of unknown function (DUF6279)
MRAAIIAALAVLAGCSALRLTYNAAPDFAYWWLDGYADFDDAQSPRVRDGIAAWFAWHRRDQLPAYAALLQRAQAEVLGETTAPQACRWWGLGRERLRAGFEQAVPALADLVVTLKPAQFAHIEARFAKANREFADDFLQPDPEERRRAGIERAVERAEMLYGRIDDAQRERIARNVAASPFDAQFALDTRRARQADILATLRRLPGAPRDEAIAALRALAERVETPPREEVRRRNAQLTSFSCAVAADFHAMTSPAQRQAAAARLRGWEADLRALAEAR